MKNTETPNEKQERDNLEKFTEILKVYLTRWRDIPSSVKLLRKLAFRFSIYVIEDENMAGDKEAVTILCLLSDFIDLMENPHKNFLTDCENRTNNHE